MPPSAFAGRYFSSLLRLNKIHPTISAHANAEGSIIYWGDETAIAKDGHSLHDNEPIGPPLLLATPGKRNAPSMVSPISSQGLMRCQFIEETMDSDWFIGFMEQQIADSNQKVLLILENLIVHHAKIVMNWIAVRKEQNKVFYLPSDSPNINSDEYQNQDFKTEHRSAERTSSKKTLLTKATSFMEDLPPPNACRSTQLI